MNDLRSSENEEMLQMLEEMQDQIESLQTDNSKAQQMISQISSENSILKSELQKKSEMIVSLNGQIEKLSGSDIVLKQNEQLRQLNSRLQLSEKQTKEKAEAEVMSVKENARLQITAAQQKADAFIESLESRGSKVANRETTVKCREQSLDAEIDQEANRRIKKKIELMEKNLLKKESSLETKYRKMTAGYQTMVFGALLYGIMVTVIAACLSETFTTDFQEFAYAIGSGITNMIKAAISAGAYVARLGDMMPQPVVAGIFHWVLQVVVTAVLIGLAGLGVAFAMKKYFDFFKKKQADEFSVTAALIILAIGVFLADTIKMAFMINIQELMLLIWSLYSFSRGILQMKNKETRNSLLKGMTITFGSIGGVTLLIYVLGPIGLLGAVVGVAIVAGGN